MKNVVKLTLALSLLSPMAFAQTNPIEDGVAACGVPACSIKDTVTALKQMNGDKRGMFAMNLKAKYKDTSDAKILENLYQLSLQMKTLSEELKDEDWIVRAAADLTNTVVFNLAKYSTVDGTKLVTYYKMFANQTSRYGLISYWQGKIASIEDLNVLNELVTFAEGARTHSINVNDEDWVARAAGSLISDITIKLTHLDPAHEGLYDVTLTDASQAVGILPFDRIAVLDSSSAKNLVVVFINSRLKMTVFSYNSAEINGNRVSGLFLSNGETANRFSFELDRKTGKVAGQIESTTHDKIEFSGKQLFSTRSVFSGKVPHEVDASDVIGTMKGELAGVPGTLTVRTFRENIYSATFAATTGSIVINFQGKFFPKNAVLSLTSADKIKLTLSLRETDKGIKWTGASFSTTTGTHAKATFEPLK